MTAPSAALRARFAACVLSQFGVTATDSQLDALVACAKPPSTTPAAVEAYRAAFGRYPAKHWWDDMAMAVQDKTEFWADVCREWAIRGYNPTNFKGMFKWFSDGVIPDAGPHKQTEPRGFQAVRDFMGAQHGND